VLPISCVNCAFNGLQYDTLGTSVGYCAEHRRILLTPTELTCGRLFRKDLPLATATTEQQRHESRYSPSAIWLLRTGKLANGSHSLDSRSEQNILRSDRVATAVMAYGYLNTKIESLAQLAVLDGARADIALLSLGRSYVRRCTSRGGGWTSGLHLFWWIRTRLTTEPTVTVTDIRVETALPLSRQIELAKWALLMLRLTVIADIGSYAKSHQTMCRVSDLAERAAAETGDLSFGKLHKWIQRAGRTAVDKALTEDEYESLSVQLHKE
jgi:hypothetical protein